MANNNLRDICVYVEKYALKHITTGDIMLEALEKELITEAQGDQIWVSMLAKRHRLGAASFSEYIEKRIVCKNRALYFWWIAFFAALLLQSVSHPAEDAGEKRRVPDHDVTHRLPTPVPAGSRYPLMGA